MVKVVYVVCLQSLIPIRWHLFRDTLFSFMANVNEDLKWKIDKAITIVILVGTNVVFFWLDEMVVIMNIVGGLFGVLLCYYIPLLIFVGVFGKQRLSSVVGYLFLFVFGVIGVVATLHGIYVFIMGKTG